MSPLEIQEITKRIEGMTDEQKALTIQCMPDEMLWNELFNRFFDNRDQLERIREAAKV